MTNTAQAHNMVAGQLFTNKITDKRILQAMAEVPREAFLPQTLKGAAYVDEDLPMGNGRVMMEPLTAARLIALAQIGESSRVLVVGALNGYVAALVAKIAQQVIAVETDKALLDEAKKNLDALGIANVEYHQVKSLADGYTLAAPYDAVIVAGAAERIPEGLGAQLSMSGKLTAVRSVAVRPGNAGGLGKLVVVTRGSGQLQYREHFDASTAMLPDFKENAAFTF